MDFGPIGKGPGVNDRPIDKRLTGSDPQLGFKRGNITTHVANHITLLIMVKQGDKNAFTTTLEGNKLGTSWKISELGIALLRRM